MWEKKGTAKTIKEYIEESSGCKAEDLLNPQAFAPETVGGLQQAAEIVWEAVCSNSPICVVGDYDADGVTASAILFLLLMHLGNKPQIRLPKRMSEGYGFSEKIITELEDMGFSGLLITVDNGISAHDTIARAKHNGWTVVVLDHHLPSETIPNADVVVDQHVPGKCKNGFRDYCGAGLAYKLAQLMLKDRYQDDMLLTKLSALAAIGTVADVMPLHDDNRVIVKKGIDAINAGDVTGGLQSILDIKKVTHLVSMDIGFQIAPLINAAGRLIDDGAKLPCAILATEHPVMKSAQRLFDLNEERKYIVEEAMKKLSGPTKENHMPYIVMYEGLDEGVVGIIAGKLAEKYGVPTFVMTNTDDTRKEWKGSARSYGDTNIKERMDKFANTMLHYGGHSGAAGFTVEIDKTEAFMRGAQAAFADVQPGDVDAQYYDLEITADQAVETFNELDKFQPFGAGCPEPIIRINNCDVRNNQPFYMSDGKHVKILQKGFSVLWFNKGEEFKALNATEYVDVIGRLSMNYSDKYGNQIQLIATDIRKRG